MLIFPKDLPVGQAEKNDYKKDLQESRRFGSCAAGKLALYMNGGLPGFTYCIPVSSISRVYKRIAMSRGGFSGRGLFAAIPYFVVEGKKGVEKQFRFRAEADVDRLLSAFHDMHPDIPVHSRAAEQKLLQKQKETARREALLDSRKDDPCIHALMEASAFLEKEPDLCQRQSQTVRQMRLQEQTMPARRRSAAIITALGLLFFLYSAYTLLRQGDRALAFMLSGLSVIFVFAGLSIIPTGRRQTANAKTEAQNAMRALAAYLQQYPEPEFPVPACLAHPVTLRRMQLILAEGKADNIPDALRILTEDLMAANASVTVEQEEFDEIMAIKPLFLMQRDIG